MSQIHLYMDEDSGDTALVLSLRNSGLDVLAVQEANREGYPDEEQLIWATEQGRVLYSSNIRDFYRLHTAFLLEGLEHAGIILVQQQRYSIGSLMHAILRLIAHQSAEEMVNQVVFIRNWIEQ